MLWPWAKREKRDSGGDFSDAVVRLIQAQAAGTAADASSTAAVEAASGALSRAFASAEVVAAPWVQEAVTPVVLAQVGRDLIRSAAIQYARCPRRSHGDGMVKLIPASSWHWEGNARSGVLDCPCDRLRALAQARPGTCRRPAWCSCVGVRLRASRMSASGR